MCHIMYTVFFLHMQWVKDSGSQPFVVGDQSGEPSNP